MADVAPPAPSQSLDLYKLAVEMADRVSARRGTANSFFLTVNTALAALLGGTELRWYVAVAGIVLACLWWALLKSYRELNAAKFVVILAIEKSLPVRIYTDEWTALKPAPDPETPPGPLARLARYRELGHVERAVPLVFMAIYAAELVRQIVE